MLDSAMIVLHEPHAVLQATGCISATKLLVAARQVLTLIYSIWSTSFDLALLDVFICVRLVFCDIDAPLALTLFFFGSYSSVGTRVGGSLRSSFRPLTKQIDRTKLRP